MTDLRELADRGFDGVALKPTEVDLDRVRVAGIDAVVIDYEGREHVPESGVLADLAEETSLRVTTPVRADGFDPLGDDRLVEGLPADAGRVLVAGNPAYLADDERARSIAPRLRAARERAPGAWIGTEGVERLALAAGGTQFELLAPGTARELRALRAAGFEGAIALYAPVALTDDEDALLDALGGYVARRGSVAAALDDARRAGTDAVAADGGAASDTTDGASVEDGLPTDAAATGRRRELLLNAIDRFALAGRPERIAERVEDLRAAGVDTVVGYPARGIDAVEH